MKALKKCTWQSVREGENYSRFKIWAQRQRWRRKNTKGSSRYAWYITVVYIQELEKKNNKKIEEGYGEGVLKKLTSDI